MIAVKRFKSPCIIAVMALAIGKTTLAQESSTPTTNGVYTLTEHLDMDMVKRHNYFGYTPEEIEKYFNYPQRFEFDTTGLATDKVKPPPQPGVHPRVLFSPEDVPALRQKFINCRPAKLQFDAIKQMLARDLTGPTATYAELYAAAVNGERRPEMANVAVSCPIIYENFRCLIENDAPAAQRAAAALTTLAQLDGDQLGWAFAKMDAQAAQDAKNPNAKPSAIQPPLRDVQAVAGITQNGLLGLGYDFAYNAMTPQQRDIVRAVIAKSSRNMTLLDGEGLPAFPANTSNWIPMHMRLILETLSIEGEQGYDPSTYHRCVEGYKRYLNVGIFDAGDAYESMGKNFLLLENLVPAANRGVMLVALKKVRTQIGGYYLHAMDPWGGHFTFYDSLGGRGNSTPMFDAIVEKYLFPNDPAIDFVYRNTVGENYEFFSGPVHFGHPFHLLDGLVKAIFAENYAPQTWQQAHDAATAGKPLTFFSNGTGNLITRASWDSNTVALHFLTRSVSGGHQYADRTSFSLYADGRYWAIYKPLRQVEGHYAPRNRSSVLIDGEGPGMTMCKCVDMQDNPQATFIAADARVPWEWDSGGNDRFPRGGKPVPFVANDFHLHPIDLPWMNMPWSDLPYWQTSYKGSENWIPRKTSMQRAFRTAGLVRGRHPYVLIVDDIQKDDQPHQYQWGMITEDDVIQQSSSGADVILTEKLPSSSGARFLLVRTLNASGTVDAPSAIDTFQLDNPPQRPIPMHRMNITRTTVAPDYQVLLFPYRNGQELPVTSWNADRTQLTVSFSDQKDTVLFTKPGDGRTRMSVMRDGQPIVALR
jgi:hypothetical protein